MKDILEIILAVLVVIWLILIIALINALITQADNIIELNIYQMSAAILIAILSLIKSSIN